VELVELDVGDLGPGIEGERDAVAVATSGLVVCE